MAKPVEVCCYRTSKCPTALNPGGLVGYPGGAGYATMFPHRLAGQPELACHFALTPTLNMKCPPYSCILSYSSTVHMPPGPTRHASLNGAEPDSPPLEYSSCLWNQNAAVVYFYSATSRCYRGAKWSIFTSALIVVSGTPFPTAPVVSCLRGVLELTQPVEFRRFVEIS